MSKTQKNQTSKKSLLINPNKQLSSVDLKLTALPFYEFIETLLPPSALIPFGAGLSASQFQFCLSQKNAQDISSNSKATSNNNIEYTVQVQLRLCLRNSTTPFRDDHYPTEFTIMINDIEVQLPKPLPVRPGQPIKRFPEPLNITSLVKIAPSVSNKINITWKPETGKDFAFAVHLVRKLSTNTLMKQLEEKGIKPANFTRTIIKEKLADDDGENEIKGQADFQVSLACPLSRTRMTMPCRASTCNHLQCFDALAFLTMNEQKATWKCPVCDKPALYCDLFIDGYFHAVINSPKLAKDDHEIILHKDGTWTNLSSENETRKEMKTNNDENILEISSDEEDVKPAAKKEKRIVKKEAVEAKAEEAAPEPRKRQPSRTSSRTNASKRLKKSSSDNVSVLTETSNTTVAPLPEAKLKSRPLSSMDSIDLTLDDD